MSVRSIREIKNGQDLNYRHFIRALGIFDQAINGKKHISIDKVKVKKRDYLVIDKLIKHQLASTICCFDDRIDDERDEIYTNNFPDYINTCFNQMVEAKKKIRLNLHWLNRAYPGFKEHFLDKQFPNLVLFDIVGSIFYSCKHLTVSMDQWDSGKNITSSYLENGLLKVLQRLNDVYHSKLKQIIIEKIRVQFNKQDLQKQKFNFYNHNWKLEVKKNDGQASSNLLLTNLRSSLTKLNFSRSFN